MMDNGAVYYSRYCGGDDKGFYDLVNEYCDGLILYINGIVGDPGFAEELADDTFLKLAVKKPAFKGRSSFKTWLYSIGRNAALDGLRKKRPADVDIDEQRDAVDEKELEAEYIKTEQNRMLYDAMNKLKPEYKEILWLMYFEGMSADEISRVLGKSKNNVNVTVLRARNSLKEILDKEGFSYEDA